MNTDQFEIELIQLLNEIKTVWPTLRKKERKRRQMIVRKGLTQRTIDNAMARYANNRRLVVTLRKLEGALFASDPGITDAKRKKTIAGKYSGLTVYGHPKPEKKGTRVTSMVSGGGLNSTGKRR